jgi:hypothetical protein
VIGGLGLVRVGWMVSVAVGRCTVALGAGVEFDVDRGSSVGVGSMRRAGWQALVISASARAIRAARTRSLVFQAKERGHFLVQHLPMVGLRRQQSLVIDEPRLLFDPFVPALGARVSQDEWSPPARKRRLAQRCLPLSAAMTRDLNSHPPILKVLAC